MRQSILVVGGLAAGPSAASKAKRVNPDAEVILIEQGEHISYGVCEVPYYIGGSVRNFDDLVPLDPSTLERTRGVKVKIAHKVEQILPTKRKLIVRDLGRDKILEFLYDKLILATGSNARQIAIEGNDAKNIFGVKSLNDGAAIKKFIDEKAPKRCVIIGGGYVGMEMCEAFVSNSKSVELLDVDDYPMTGFEEETRKAVLAELTKNGVSFRAKQQVRSFVKDSNGNIRSVITNAGSFDCDVVIMAVGVEPNTALAAQTRIQLGSHNGILTDERQLTNIDSIFAAGDCCEVKSLVTGKRMYIPLATYAARQGRVAGENAAGGRAVFKGAIRAIAVKVFGLEIAQVGISSFEAQEANFECIKVHVKSDTKVHYFPGNESLDIVAIADRKSQRLLGANVFGGVSAVLRSEILGFAIQQRMTVSELSQLDMIYSPPFSPLWDPVLVLANQMKNKLGTLR